MKSVGGGAVAAAACFVLSLAGGAAVAASEQFKVGGDEGWRQPEPENADMYALWAGRTSFRVGDSVYFEYGDGDSVVVVDKRGYYHCNTTNATAAFHDGRTVFALDEPGLLYFVSGEPGHCNSGQRLIVDVPAPAPPHRRPSPSPPPATPDAVPSQSPLPIAAAAGGDTATVPALLASAALASYFASFV